MIVYNENLCQYIVPLHNNLMSCREIILNSGDVLSTWSIVHSILGMKIAVSAIFSVVPRSVERVCGLFLLPFSDQSLNSFDGDL